MAKLYYWAMKDGNVGHLSLELSDGTYISHWPSESAGLVKKYGGGQNSLKEDEESEGGAADEILHIPGAMIDENRIKAWWSECIKSGTTYHMLFSNCGQMVREGLLRGGIREPLSFQHFSGNDTITPFDVLSWAKQCIDLHNAPRNPFYVGNWFK